MAGSPRSPKRNSYVQTKFNTASPGQRVVLMYDGIIKYLTLAQQAFALEGPERIEKIHDHLTRVAQIISELRLALDHKADNELASTLENLYIFWERQLSDANTKKKPDNIADVLNMVTELRDTWNNALQGEAQ